MNGSSKQPSKLSIDAPRRYRYVRLRWRVLFAVIDALGSCLFAIAGAMRRLLGLGRAAGLGRDPRTILLVQLDHLGDAILSTGLLQGLRHRFPDSSIDVLASESNRELFELCPQVDRVFVSRVNRLARGRRWGWPLSTLAWGWRLRRHRYELAIDPRGEFPVALLLWLCGARHRLGWAAGGGGFLLSGALSFAPNRHEVLSRQALLASLHIEPSRTEFIPFDTSGYERNEFRSTPATAWPPRVRPTDDARAWLDRQLADWREPQRPLVVLHIGAGTSAKRWPLEHWRELLGRAIVELNAQVIIVGSPPETATSRAILEGRNWPGVLDSTGRLSLAQLAALLERAAVLVSADSGPAHLAAAVGTPVAVLFSGTNRAEQWKPWGAGVAVVRREVACSPCHCEVCPLAHHPCMREVLPSAVLAAMRSLLTADSWKALTPALFRITGRGSHDLSVVDSRVDVNSGVDVDSVVERIPT